MATKHEDILSIDQFLGLNQSADNLRMSFAASGYNFSVNHGVLQSVREPYRCATETGVNPDFPIKDYETSRDLSMTLAFISQRWKDGYSGAIPADTTWLITVVDGKIYARKNVSGLNKQFVGTDWIEIYDGAFVDDLFDCVTYEINYAPPVIFTLEMLVDVANGKDNWYVYDNDDYAYHAVKHKDGAGYYTNLDGEEKPVNVDESYVRLGYSYPVDALLMSNAKDGMFLVYCEPAGAGNETTLKVVRIKVQPIGETEEMKFGCIARYAERIWGAGIETDPDKLVYSAPYDVFNWEQNNREPDDGAGDIQQPDWDGDGFRALRSFGNQLVCFKKHSIWAITGTSPGAFYMRKQYGHGTIYEDSIAVYGGSMFFVTDTGMHAYDAISVSPVKHGYIDTHLKNFMGGNVRNSIGCMCAGKYYFTLSNMVSESAMLCYDTIEGTISEYALAPFAIAAHDDQVYMITPDEGKVQLSVLEGTGAAEMEYTTAWTDFGAKHVVKSEFEVYLAASVYMGDKVKVKLSIETESRKKEKEVTLESGKIKRVRLNAKGRKLRFGIHADRQEDPWNLMGGVQIAYSLDYD